MLALVPCIVKFVGGGGGGGDLCHCVINSMKSFVVLHHNGRPKQAIVIQ